MGNQAAERRLQYYLGSKSEPGSVFAQGTIDGVDYRKMLNGAIVRDSHSLSAIFQYTGTRKLMGEGAESNSDILLQLLRLWGDAAYARVLAAKSSEVRSAIVGELDSTWDVGWRAQKYPVTYRAAKHDTSYRR